MYLNNKGEFLLNLYNAILYLERKDFIRVMRAKQTNSSLHEFCLRLIISHYFLFWKDSLKNKAHLHGFKQYQEHSKRAYDVLSRLKRILVCKAFGFSKCL